MEGFFHLIFELIKISISGCAYATLTLLIFKIIGHYKPDSWFDSVSKKKLRFWFLSGHVISVGLFFFMFTYYGNHGLGDNARVPVGHFKVVRHGGSTYIQNS
jgi:O-antigen/teichoic acid export membrane protein